MNDKPRILVIDDELSESLELYINSLGYDVTVTNSAIKGLKFCKDNDNKFDVIILDIGMPDMDGLEFLDDFDPNKETTVIMLTAYDERQLAVDAMKKGAFDFVSKDEATMVLDEKIKKAYKHALMIKKFNEGQKKLSDLINLEKKIKTGRDSKSVLREIIKVMEDLIPYDILITAIFEDKSDHYQVIKCKPEEHKITLLSKTQIERGFLDYYEQTEDRIKTLRYGQKQNESIFKAIEIEEELNTKSVIIIPLRYLLERIGFIAIYTNSPKIKFTFSEKEYLEFYSIQAAEIIKILNLISEVSRNQIYKFNKGLIHELSHFPLTFERGILGNSEEDKKDALNELDRFCDLIGELKAISSGIEKKFILEKTSLYTSIKTIIDYTKKKINKFSTNDNVKKVQLREVLENDVVINEDKSKLYAALKIIIDNGLRAIYQDKTKQEGELSIRCYGDKKYGIIKISDNGIGMDNKFMSKIFDPFISGNKGGWGVGLAFANEIIQEHGGLIKVESEPGIGSHFYIHIPIADQKDSLLL